jgi:predicted transcriptional regulator of viral defense system
MSASDYINQLLSYEEYSFSFKELSDNSPKSKQALISELKRLSDKKEIVNLRHGFFLILPPRYRNIESLPLELYINKLFEYLQKPYYVACLSAARFHGSAHQQIQKDYVITIPPPIRDSYKTSNVKFLTCSHWPAFNIVKKKSEAGYYNISSPVLTVVDLINYQSQLGGLNKQFTVIQELSEEIELNDLKDLLKWYPNKSTLQRLGYLLAKLQINPDFTDMIYSELVRRKIYPILLDPGTKKSAEDIGNLWKVNMNIELESDL